MPQIPKLFAAGRILIESVRLWAGQKSKIHYIFYFKDYFRLF